MDRHSDPFMMIIYTADKLRKVSLHFSQRQSRHSQKYDQNSSGGSSPLLRRRGPTRRLPMSGTFLGWAERRLNPDRTLQIRLQAPMQKARS